MIMSKLYKMPSTKNMSLWREAEVKLPCPLSLAYKALTDVRKMIFSIKVFVTLLDYLKIPQVAILGDLHA
jgi:hypothetical protein